MMLINNIVHLKFFKNRGLRELCLAIFIMTFGESLINIFVPIYLYNKGFQVYEILAFYFLASLFFIFFAYHGARIVAKVGNKHAILISTPFLISYYLGLIFIDQSIVLFFILPLFLALRMILFNYGNHLTFINNSEESKRGREVSFLGAITLIATISAPYIGGVFASINFSLLFVISALLIIFSIVPLFFSPEKYEKINFTSNLLFKKAFHREDRGNFISFGGYAVESIINRTVWPIFIILVVETVGRVGFVVSLSMVISLLFFYAIGKITDKIDKVKLLRIGSFLYFLGWVARIFADTSTKIILVDSYKNLSAKILRLPWSAHSYDIAARSNYFEFIVIREIIFNLARIAFLPVLIYLFLIDFYPFLISFMLASLFSLGYGFVKR